MKTYTFLGQTEVSVRESLGALLGMGEASRIIEKTGPEKVFVCDVDTDALDLSVSAFEIMKAAATDEDLSIQNLIYVTENGRLKYPGNGYLFANSVGLSEDIFILDVNAGCTGFVDALRIASTFEEKALVVCAETYSKNSKSFNRAVSPIFSDAASVTIYDPKEWKVVDFVSKIDSSNWEAISCQIDGEIRMNGRLVFEFVNGTAFPIIRKILNDHKVDFVFLHQGSRLVVEHLVKKLASENYHIPENILVTGNLVSATIPRLIEDTFGHTINVAKGTKLLLASFGVGLAVSAIVLEKQ